VSIEPLLDKAQERMEALGVPGCAIGILDGGDETVRGLGVTSVEHPLEVDGDTLFQIGSITKTFTGTLAMRLVEEGRLDLDAPVRTYLPALRLQDDDVAARVTMRHLLTHTGGWVGDYFDDTGRGDDALALMCERLAELPQETPLGELWAYNNAGFYLAGRVVEVVTGQPFEDALAELVLAPLGLERSFFSAEDVLTHRFAVGHDREGKVARPWALSRSTAAAGGLVSSVRELLRYARFQFGDGEGILRRETLEAMREPAVPAAGFADWVGLTWYGRDYDGRRFVGHRGGTNGQISLLQLCPAEGWALAVLTNHDDGGDLTRAVFSEAIRARFGIEVRDAEPVEASREQVDEVCGLYDAALGTYDLHLVGGKLVAEVRPKGGFPKRDSPPSPGPPPFELAFTSRDELVVLDGPTKGATAQLLRDDDGRIVWLRAGGRLHRRGV
jgi:CubicO group peptidase (beta-lactamase class C family)